MDPLIKVLFLTIVLVVCLIIFCIVKWKRMKDTERERRATLEASEEIIDEIRTKATSLDHNAEIVAQRLERLNSLLEITTREKEEERERGERQGERGDVNGDADGA